MINKIIDGISLKLFEEFGEEYEIYADKTIEQGLTEPCFFIALLSSSNTPKLKGRYLRNNPFVISYFPKDITSNTEINTTAERLYIALEYIELLGGDTIRGTSMSYEVVDDVLHFRVNYNCYLKNVEDITPMEEVVIKEVGIPTIEDDNELKPPNEIEPPIDDSDEDMGDITIGKEE